MVLLTLLNVCSLLSSNFFIIYFLYYIIFIKLYFHTFVEEHIGHVVRMSVSGYSGDGSNPGNISMLCP